MKRVLVLSPHPDDEALGCGGALCKHLAEGDSVAAIFLTSGEAGGHDNASAEETGLTREREARAACALLGVTDLEFWRLPDGKVASDAANIERLVRSLAEHAPDIVYAPHAREGHPDHGATFELIRAAVSDSRLTVSALEVRLYEVWTPLQRMDLIIDITPFIEMKVSAIRAYASQCRVMRFDDAARGLARYRGEMHSWPGGDYAEVFILLGECS